MKNKKWFIFVLVFLCVSFTTCENPIIRQWWVKDEPEPEYIPVYRDIPYEEIVNIIVEMPIVSPPDVIEIVKNLRIVAIEYIIFSGDQYLYNEASPSSTGTSLNKTEKDTNDSTVRSMAQALLANPGYKAGPQATLGYMLMLHGHANPVEMTEAERKELKALSTARAIEVEKEIKRVFTAPPFSGNINQVPVSGPPPITNLKWGGSNPPFTGHQAPGTKKLLPLDDWESDWEAVPNKAAWDGRVAMPTGYSGEKTLFPSNSFP